MDIADLGKLPAMLNTPMFNGTLGIALHDGHPCREHPPVGYWKGMSNRNPNMTIPRQLALGEGKGKKKENPQPKPRPVSPGRPRREIDVELLRELRNKGYGYKRIAGEYTRLTEEYISHTTVRERLVDG